MRKNLTIIVLAALGVDALSVLCVYILGEIWGGREAFALTNPLELLIGGLANFPLMLFLSYKVTGQNNKHGSRLTSGSETEELEQLDNSPDNKPEGGHKHEDFY